MAHDLRHALEELKYSILDETSLVSPREIYMTGPQLIEAYQSGFLVPGDESVYIHLSPSGMKQVQEFLKTFTPPPPKARRAQA